MPAAVWAQAAISYAKVKKDLELPGDNRSPVLVFIINTHSDCAMCNLKTYSIWNDTAIQQIPHSNKVLLMRDIRKVERKFYEQRFSFMENPVKIITNGRLYDQYMQLIPRSSPQGGVAIFSADSTQCIYPFNTAAGYTSLVDCFLAGSRAE